MPVKHGFSRVVVRKMARPERFELPTPRFVVWCSIQLSYGRSACDPRFAAPAWEARRADVTEIARHLQAGLAGGGCLQSLIWVVMQIGIE